MATDETLIEQIDTLIENAIIEPSENFIISGSRKTFFSGGSEDKEEICGDPKIYTFNNIQVIALKALYFQLSKSEQKFFVDRLIDKVKNDSNNIGLISFNTLCHLGFFLKTLPLIQLHILDNRSHKYSNLLILFSDLLKHEWNNYPLIELKQLKKWINDCFENKNVVGKNIHQYPSLYEHVSSVFSKLYRQINILLTKSIRKQIFSGYNPEINEDQNKLTDEFRRYSFPTDLSDTLRKIDDKFTSATDNFDNKSCMDLIRSFTERLYQSISIAIDNTGGRKIDVTDSESVAKFFNDTPRGRAIGVSKP